MQLDATLNSFFLHCLDAEKEQIYILYLATDERNVSQYKSLIAAYPSVMFIKQTDFQLDVNAILNPYQKGGCKEKKYCVLCKVGMFGFRVGSILERIRLRTLGYIQRMFVQKLMPTPPDKTYILFLVDDNLFVRDFSLAEAISTMEDHPDSLGVSLRLGRNTRYCYAFNCPQSLPVFSDLQDGWMKFNWTSSEYDFGYPLEVSSSIYRTKEIIPLISGLHFQNPNDLEAHLASYRFLFLSKFPNIICFEQSITFCNPVNIVQDTANNRAGEQFPFTIEDMITRFDQGDRIRVENYSGFTPNACHQEMELIFDKIKGD